MKEEYEFIIHNPVKGSMIDNNYMVHSEIDHKEIKIFAGDVIYQLILEVIKLRRKLNEKDKITK